MAGLGMVRLAADFGTGDGGGEGGAVDTAAIDARLDEIDARVVDLQAYRETSLTSKQTKAQLLANIATVWDGRLGPFRDLAREAKELVHAPKVDPGPVDPPAPEPAPTFPVGGFARTYSTHGQAWDFYPNGPNGPHHGWWAVAPATGRVELYTFPTPLDVFRAMSAEQQDQAADLFQNWLCMDPEIAVRVVPAGHQGPLPPHWVTLTAVTPAQTMYVPVYWPDQPITVQGQRLVWIGQGHSRGETVKQGRVNTGDRLWQFWNSGVNFEARGIPGRCAHGHMICGVSATLSPNGDIPGGYAILALGMPLPQLTSGNWGPDAYMAGLIQAGQTASYWQTHPLPPPAE